MSASNKGAIPPRQYFGNRRHATLSHRPSVIQPVQHTATCSMRLCGMLQVAKGCPYYVMHATGSTCCLVLPAFTPVTKCIGHQKNPLNLYINKKKFLWDISLQDYMNNQYKLDELIYIDGLSCDKCVGFRFST